MEAHTVGGKQEITADDSNLRATPGASERSIRLKLLLPASQERGLENLLRFV